MHYALDFVGTGPDEDELMLAMEGYPQVRVLNPVPYAEMPRIYPQYDVLVLTSESEGLSIAMLEAMSFGVVPVVTRVSGAEDIIVDGQNGFLCEIGDMGAMADRLARLAASRTELAVTSEEAFKTAFKKYTVEGHFANLRRVIDEVMSKPLATAEAAASCL